MDCALLYRFIIRIQYFRKKFFINKLFQPRQMDKFFRDVKQLLATRNFPCNLNFVFYKLFTQILRRAIVSSMRELCQRKAKKFTLTLFYEILLFKIYCHKIENKYVR